ncbi:MAG: nucleotidyltransferase domain-containing protein [Phycisphaerales bacterium]
MNLDRTVIDRHLGQQRYPLLFVTVSGAHLYGFDSPDSDYDLRGCHVTTARELFRLDPPGETIEVMEKPPPPAIEMDLVTHDARKFFTLLLKNNGYVLEQVFSPLVVQAAPEFEELKALAVGCITRHHRHHFLSFAQNQWELVVKGGRPTTKGLLYTYRVILAGIHLMRSGRVESNLRVLNREFKLGFVDDLIAMKIAGAEKAEAKGQDLAWHEREFARLVGVLDEARAATSLPEEVDPKSRAGLNELLVRLRLQTV